MGQKTTTAEENHDLQRATAQKLRVNWPAAESVRFTQEGSYAGSGQWAVSAVVTIEGETYDETLGPGITFGEPLPDPDASSSSESLTVFYSDGSSEVLK